MPKLAWFPFYGRDFFEDEKVKLMTHAQVGMYLRLLQHQWLEGSVSEPLAHSFLMSSGKKATIERREMDAVLAHCFTHTSAIHPLRLMNPRMERIRSEQLQKEANQHPRNVKGGQSLQAQRRHATGSQQASPRLVESESESETEREEEEFRNCISLTKGGSESDSTERSASDALDHLISQSFMASHSMPK